MGGHSSGGLFPGTSGSFWPSGQGSEGGGTISDGNETAGSQRETLLAQATTPEVERIVDELYREGADVGDGGTADAIREQLQSGELVGGRDHIRKGQERLRQIEKILERNPNHPDRDLLERLRDDLKDALGGA